MRMPCIPEPGRELGKCLDANLGFCACFPSENTLALVPEVFSRVRLMRLRLRPKGEQCRNRTKIEKRKNSTQRTASAIWKLPSNTTENKAKNGTVTHNFFLFAKELLLVLNDCNQKVSLIVVCVVGLDFFGPCRKSTCMAEF